MEFSQHTICSSLLNKIEITKKKTHTKAPPCAIHEALCNFCMRACRRGTSINRYLSLCLPLNNFDHLNQSGKKMNFALFARMKQCTVLANTICWTHWVCVAKQLFLIVFFTLEWRAHFAWNKAQPTYSHLKHRVNTIQPNAFRTFRITIEISDSYIFACSQLEPIQFIFQFRLAPLAGVNKIEEMSEEPIFS